MSAFNWDEHPIVNSFNWDDHPVAQASEVPMLQTALGSGLNAAAANALPVIEGASTAGMNLASGGKLADLLADYQAARDKASKELKKEKNANPKTAMLAGMAGSVPAMALAGPTGYGALSGLGESVSEGQGLGSTIANTAIGGATGGLLGKAGEAVGVGLGALPGGLAKPVGGALAGGALGAGLAGANKDATGTDILHGAELGAGVGAVGGALTPALTKLAGTLGKTEIGDTLGSAFNMGKEGTNLFDKATRQEIGQEGYGLAEKYIGKEGLITGKGQLLSQKGKDIENLIKASQDTTINIGEGKGQELYDKILDKFKNLDVRDPEQASDREKLMGLVQNFISSEEVNPSDLQGLKSAISNLSPFKNDSLRSQQGANASKLAAQDIGQAVEQQVPGLEEANTSYSDLQQALKYLKVNPKKLGTDEQKQIENLGNIIYRLKNTTKTGDLARQRFDKGLGKLEEVAPELASQFENEAQSTAKRIEVARKASNEAFPGNSVIGTIKGASTLAANAAGMGAQKVSNVMSSVNQKLINAPKESIVSFGQDLINSGGELETRLGNILVKAADRDDIGRNALIFSLSQNAAYRELLRKHIGQDDTKQ